MSIHNALFFTDPRSNLPGRVKRHGMNVVVNQMTDDDFNTSSGELDIDVDISDGASPTRVDYIFLKYTGTLTAYTVTPSGGSGGAFTRESVPSVVKNAEGGDVPLLFDGYKHDLYEVPDTVTARSVRIEFSGTGVGIVVLMVLELGYEVNANQDFSRILPYRNDRAGNFETTPLGGARRSPSLGGAREKLEYDLTAMFIPDMNSLSAREWLAWRGRNHNCGFSREFTRYPEQVMLATFPDLRVSTPYRHPRYKGAGVNSQFQLWER